MNLILISKKFLKIATRLMHRNLIASLSKKKEGQSQVHGLKSKKHNPDSPKDMINKCKFCAVSIYMVLVLHTPARVAIATEKVTTLPAVRNQLVIPKPKSIENVTPEKSSRSQRRLYRLRFLL